MLKKHKCYVIDTKQTIVKKRKDYKEVIKRITEADFSKYKLEDIYFKMNGSTELPNFTYLREEFSLPIYKNIVGLYLVEVRINGRAYKFLLDTGAQVSSIDNKLLEELDLKENETMLNISSFSGKEENSKSTTIEDLTIGDLRIKDIAVMINPKSLLGNKALGIDGILGWDILSRMDFEIDDKNSLFRCIKINKEVEDMNLVMGVFPTLIIKDINNKLVIAGLDSGALTSWISKASIERNKLEVVKEGEALGLGIHGMENIMISVVKQVRYKLGKSHIVIENVNTGKTALFDGMEYDIVLGNEVFKNRCIQVITSKGCINIL
ncbi:MAG: retropepsin-like aspartic protease [Erysipelotrichaceae bacterium]